MVKAKHFKVHIFKIPRGCLLAQTIPPMTDRGGKKNQPMKDHDPGSQGGGEFTMHTELPPCMPAPINRLCMNV